MLHHIYGYTLRPRPVRYAGVVAGSYLVKVFAHRDSALWRHIIKYPVSFGYEFTGYVFYGNV